MKKRGIDKDIVLLLISTLITVASWVGFEVYRAYSKVTLTPEVEQSLAPIDSTLNKKVFDKLEMLQQ